MTKSIKAACTPSTGTLNIHNVNEIIVERCDSAEKAVVYKVYFFTDQGVFTVTTFSDPAPVLSFCE